VRQRRRERQRRRRRTTAFPVGVPEPGCRGHVAVQLPEASNLGGAMSTPAAEDAARGCGGAASGKLRLAPALGVRTSWSTIRPRLEPASSSAAGTRSWGRSHGIGGQESSRTRPRCPEYHRSPATSGKRRLQPRPPFASRQRPASAVGHQASVDRGPLVGASME
jgi:hypothetical protein